MYLYSGVSSYLFSVCGCAPRLFSLGSFSYHSFFPSLTCYFMCPFLDKCIQVEEPIYNADATVWDSTISSQGIPCFHFWYRLWFSTPSNCGAFSLWGQTPQSYGFPIRFQSPLNKALPYWTTILHFVGTNICQSMCMQNLRIRILYGCGAVFIVHDIRLYLFSTCVYELYFRLRAYRCLFYLCGCGARSIFFHVGHPPCTRYMLRLWVIIAIPIYCAVLISLHEIFPSRLLMWQIRAYVPLRFLHLFIGISSGSLVQLRPSFVHRSAVAYICLYISQTSGSRGPEFSLVWLIDDTRTRENLALWFTDEFVTSPFAPVHAAMTTFKQL